MGHALIDFNNIKYKDSCRHGDMIYVVYTAKPIIKETGPLPIAFIKQHPIDDLLEKQDGLIKRNRDPI